MARLNLDKMSYAELSELRSNVERMMLEKHSSERSALRRKMARDGRGRWNVSRTAYLVRGARARVALPEVS
jgi:hypothetical protein